MPPNNLNETQPVPPRPIPESYWVIPGRLLAGEYPGVIYSPELTRKRLDAFLEAGCDTFFDLTREGETQDYSALLLEQAAYYGQTVEVVRFPIDDFGLPTRALMTSVLDAIDNALAAGRRPYLHCRGGIGRTGTVVGCYLVRQGYSGADALRQLATWWKAVPKSRRSPNSPETLEQERFVLEWSEG